MNATWSNVAAEWTIRPVTITVIILCAVLYMRGRATVADRPDVKQRPVKFAVALFILGMAVLSPIDYLARHFFFMRVLQHLMIISFFPVLFMSSDPLPSIFAGLPGRWQTRLRRFTQTHLSTIKRLTPKGIIWFVFLTSVWIWYDPQLHAFVRDNWWLHTVEITLMPLAALGHWWHVTAAHPRLHPRLPSFAHIGYTIAGAAPLKIPGLFLLLSTVPVYGYGTGTFFGWELDPLAGQRLGGGVIWAMGGILYSLTAGSYFTTWLAVEEAKPVQPLDERLWDDPDRMMAPGLKK